MARRKEPVIADAILDQLLAGSDAKSAFDSNGLIDQLKKALAERALNAEMDHHLSGEGDRQQPQRLWKEDGFDRRWVAGTVYSAGSAIELRSAAPGEVSAALPRLQRQDHLDVCAWHEYA